MARLNLTSTVWFGVLLIGTLFLVLSIWEKSEWEEWESSAAPEQLLGTYVREQQEPGAHAPDRIILESETFRYQFNTDGQRQWTQNMVCGGTSYRDGKRHIIWLSRPGLWECGSGHYARVRYQDDEMFIIEEYIEPVHVAGEDNFRQLWQSDYALQK